MAYVKKCKLLFTVLQTLFIMSRSLAELSEKVRVYLYLRDGSSLPCKKGSILNSLKQVRLIVKKPTKIHICTATFSVFA